MKLHVSELDLPSVDIQERNVLLFQPWNMLHFHYINSFPVYSKTTVTSVIFQRIFAYHHSQCCVHSAIFTDGSKQADYVGCGVMIEENIRIIGLTLLAAFSLQKLLQFIVQFN
ncbi:RNase H domain-containing protein [Trichonephila clavipes]|nr:RNase H domain-containing protein [Trichonephila clavipes]